MPWTSVNTFEIRVLPLEGSMEYTLISKEKKTSKDHNM